MKAAHLFLSENEIGNIKQYVPQAINGVPALVIAENENGKPVGFMGIADKMLEMIFISNESREQGMGKKLLEYGIENYSINKLAVNEQNHLAKGFHEHMGFKVYKRTELDEQRNPYPLLYIKRERAFPILRTPFERETGHLLQSASKPCKPALGRAAEI